MALAICSSAVASPGDVLYDQYDNAGTVSSNSQDYEAALKLEPGGVTGVETSRSNLYYVVRLLGIRKGRAVVYSARRAEVLESILQDPPAQQEYARWVEGELVRCRIEYSDPASRRERAKGPP